MGGGGESEGMISKIGPVGVKRKRIDEVMEGGRWCAGEGRMSNGSYASTSVVE